MSARTLIPCRWAPLTPSDTALLQGVIGLYAGNAGAIVGAGIDGVTATFQVQAGQYLSGLFTKVLGSGTTSTGIVALLKE